MTASNGCVLWEGHSPWDTAPISVVATGLVKPSQNPKTGPMIQVYVLRTDIAPHIAVRDGLDASVCNDCELRQFTVKQEAAAAGLPPGAKPPMCYVTTSQSVRQVYQAMKSGKYPLRPDWANVVRGRKVRLGAYGNFSNAPSKLIEEVCAGSAGWTLYEHNWRRSPWMQPYAMASVSSLDAKKEANAAGWRTFRVKRASEPTLPDEVVCPAAEEAGKRTTCEKCLLCCGTSKKAKNVVINDHGPTSGLVQLALRARKEAL